MLSDFGMVPAAAIGIDVRTFLERTAEMVRSCSASAPPVENPGVLLGAILGVAAKQGRDKLTVIASPGIASFGAWLEQLLAESTGKQGRGIIPVDAEPVGTPAVYGQDRVFAYLRLGSEQDQEHESAVAALEAAGQPVVRIVVSEAMQLGQEFFRWEMATAVAGAIIGINPFDQPDVEASKVKTRELTDAFEKTGALPEEKPVATARRDCALRRSGERGGPVRRRDARGRAEGASRPGRGRRLCRAARLYRPQPGACRGVAAHAPDDPRPYPCRDLRRLRSALPAFDRAGLQGRAEQRRVPADHPRTDAEDVPVPGQAYSFGVVKAAQARGDFDVLAERGRRLLRVHLPRDVDAGLQTLARALEEALR